MARSILPTQALFFIKYIAFPSYLKEILLKSSGRHLIWQTVPYPIYNTMPACVLIHFSRVRLFVTPWTVALQAPLSMGFSRQDYWSGLPCPPPGDLPPGIEPAHTAGGFFIIEPPGKPIYHYTLVIKLTLKVKHGKRLTIITNNKME